MPLDNSTQALDKEQPATSGLVNEQSFSGNYAAGQKYFIGHNTTHLHIACFKPWLFELSETSTVDAK